MLKIISTSEQRAEHLFAGQNTQQSVFKLSKSVWLVKSPSFNTGLDNPVYGQKHPVFKLSSKSCDVTIPLEYRGSNVWYLEEFGILVSGIQMVTVYLLTNYSQKKYFFKKHTC